MRIQFAVEGGFAVFPGLARPVSIDVDDLPGTSAAALRDAVERSRFFDRAEPAPVSGGADMRQYTVTVEDAGRSRTLTIPDSVDDAALQTLLRLLEDQRRNAIKR